MDTFEGSPEEKRGLYQEFHRKIEGYENEYTELRTIERSISDNASKLFEQSEEIRGQIEKIEILRKQKFDGRDLTDAERADNESAMHQIIDLWDTVISLSDEASKLSDSCSNIFNKRVVLQNKINELYGQLTASPETN